MDANSHTARATRWLVVPILLCVLTGCGPDLFTTIERLTPSIWVGAWGNSPANAEASLNDNPGGAEQSYRFLVYPTIGGTQERVRFSNFFGKTTVTIGAGRLAIGALRSRAVDPAHDVPLTFNGGASEVKIAPGQIVVSDPVQLTYSYGQALAVSIYLSGVFPPLTRHGDLFNLNYKTLPGAGDKTGDVSGASFTKAEGDWLLLNGIDVYGPYQGTVVLLGSSTTDGYKSNYGSTNVYPVENVPVADQFTSRLPDWLAQQLNAGGYRIGVINAGISGDTITPDVTNQSNHVQDGVDRFNRDVAAQPNVLAMVTYLGSIDLRSSDCKSAPAIESSTEQLVTMANAAHIRVVLGTIPPSAFCTNSKEANYGPSPTKKDPYAGGEAGSLNPSETERIALDGWMRTTGAALPGVVGIADFDAALADPSRPHFLLPLYNSGDNFHPNGMGYRAEAGAIPLTVLLPPGR